ncbi:unnamed protein product [Soboliphyme baturini]|uniref:Uncharacterized protein n=1 Tax=Soboliphyme baturini TaxID=241478 RepID=A0A183IDU4_9BILA|nr:unnamed protein product [Soboliphyme baturini]
MYQPDKLMIAFAALDRLLVEMNIEKASVLHACPSALTCNLLMNLICACGHAKCPVFCNRFTTPFGRRSSVQRFQTTSISTSEYERRLKEISTDTSGIISGTEHKMTRFGTKRFSISVCYYFSGRQTPA